MVSRFCVVALLLGLFDSVASAQNSFVYTNNHAGIFPSSINTVSGFTVGTDGVFKEIPGSPFSAGAQGGGSYGNDADILVIGDRLYVANSGGNPTFPGISSPSISVFSINATTGFLTHITGSPFIVGNSPIEITLAATLDGRFLYLGQPFDRTITVFSIGVDGSFAPVSGAVYTVGTGSAFPSLKNMKVTPDGRFLAVSQLPGIFMYQIDSGGRLTLVPGSPFFHSSSQFAFRSLDVNCESTFLYAVRPEQFIPYSEVYSISPTGSLIYSSSAPFLQGWGRNTVFGMLSPNDRYFFVSDFSVSKAIASFTVAPDGSLGVVPGSPFSIGASGVTDESVPGGLATNRAGTILYASLRRNLIGAYAISSNGALSPVPGTAVAARDVGITTEIYALAAYPGRTCQPVPVFDFCIQDESNGNLLKFNSTTGNYQFTNCSTLTLNGTASIIRKGGIISLQHYGSDRRLIARIDTSSNIATASIQVFGQASTFGIIDRNISNNSCSCNNGS